MKEKIEKLKTFLAGTTTISNREFVLAMAVGILGGIVFGLLTSPRKIRPSEATMAITVPAATV